jgi:hypothetical protein
VRRGARPASSRPRARAGALVALALAAGGRASRDASAQPEPAWTYEATVAEDLSRISVRLCFEGFRPKRLILASGGDLGHVRPAAGEPRASGFDPGTRSWAVDADADDVCVAYEAALVEPTRGTGRGGRASGAVVTEAGSWLLRPAEIPVRLRARVRFRLPAGASVSTPWERDPTDPGTSFALDATTWAFIGHVAIGRLSQDAFQASGAEVRVATLPGDPRSGREGVRAWLSAAVGAVADVFGGRYPRDRVQAIVRPVDGGGDRDPVPFGSSWQGGGPALVLLLAKDASPESLVGEWVAVHELVHLSMPVVAPEDAWLSEGFATYYQEVLRARAGLQTARQAWQAIEDGFGRGRRSGGERTLEEESRRMRETHEFLRVYWAGAALALLLDVDLRRHSGGRVSLDDAMRRLAQDLGSPRPLSGADVVSRIDAWAGRPVLSSLATPALASRDFPSVEAAYAWLGVRVEDGRVSLDDAAPGAAQRRAVESRRGRGAGPPPSRSQ